MTVQSQMSSSVDTPPRMRRGPRHQQHESVVATNGDPGRLRCWRPFPREAGDIICGEGSVAELPIHTHDALLLTLPASRFALVDGRGGRAVVRPGQVHIAAPQELHGARSLDGVPCAMRVILVAPAELAKRGEKHVDFSRAAAPECQPCVVDDPALYAELWALIGDVRGPLVALDCAPRLLACVVRLLDRVAARPSLGARQRAGRQVVGVDRVSDHLRAHVADHVSLDELASVAGLSKYYLLRAFRRAHGVTPHAYQMQLRLAHAWRLIAEGCALTRATYDAGFADQSHLTRRFAAVFGLTPARYARQLALQPGAAASDAFGGEPSAAPRRRA